MPETEKIYERGRKFFLAAILKTDGGLFSLARLNNEHN